LDRRIVRNRVHDAIGEPVDGGSIHGGNYNDRMLAIRYLALAALVVWLGGMVVLGLLVAPSIFGTLQSATHDAAQGRVLAGATFGEILRRFHYLAYGCGAILIAALLVMKLVGPPPQTFI